MFHNAFMRNYTVKFENLRTERKIMNFHNINLHGNLCGFLQQKLRGVQISINYVFFIKHQAFSNKSIKNSLQTFLEWPVQLVRCRTLRPRQMPALWALWLLQWFPC